MKNILIILLLLLISWQVNAQNKQAKDPYMPILADTLYWWEVFVPEFENYELEHYYTFEKQIYNDTVYHFLGGAWHVEDTTERRVYRMSSSNLEIAERHLMYDFSLDEGDSLWHNDYVNNYHWFYVDSIRYIDTYAGPREVWYLHFDYDDKYIEYPVWVEGIGSLAGFWRFNMQPGLDWWGWGILNCWYADDELIYKSDFAEQWGCQLEYLDIEELSEPNVVLYPNPVTNISILSFPNRNASKINLYIYNILGQQIYYSQTQGPEFEIYKLNFKQGLYIYKLINNKSILFSNTFIIK